MNRVVYIDDESDICAVVDATLRHAGIRVSTHTDPTAALADIHGDAPALVLCDYRMPGMSGLALLHRIESDVPFALISGDLEIHDIEEPRVVDVLRKPLRPEDLITFVQRYV
ncbi:MAG: response regulator [Planctomycetes bacterium]|nr:response regulator [Planctomycetota bacterium]